MREIVLDTETTGLDPKAGHRIVEIGCVELRHHAPTGRDFHVYLNPERDMPDEAFQVHGLSEAFLDDKPLFADIVDEFLEFLGDASLVIHNAEFDMRFINAELERVHKPTIPMERSIDTIAMARKRFGAARVNLDALCARFEIDNTNRTKHGALLDADLLTKVYIELLGGKQIGLTLASDPLSQHAQDGSTAGPLIERQYRPPRPHGPTEDEKSAHAALLEKIKDPIWTRTTP